MQPQRIEKTVIIPQPISEVWSFFSRPENLNKITPDKVSFQILSPIEGQKMYKGMVVQYIIKPLLGIPMHWVTEITQIEKYRFFIDDQRVGPYALWHHQHHFEKVEGGTRMTDILHYQVPYGIIGSIANFLFVKKMVNEIFDYREQAIKEFFK